MISSWTGKRAVVTGGAGYIGSRLCEELIALGAKVHVYSGSRPIPASLQAKVTSQSMELATETFADLPRHAPDVIFHLAAQTSHYRANENPEADWALNARPTLALIRAATGCGNPRILQASTVTVLGSHPTLVAQPDTVYDAHKFAAESYLRSLYPCHATLRLANVYGPSAASSTADRGVIQQWIAQAMQGNPVSLYGTGEWLRDFVYLDDVVQAFLAVGAAKARAVEGNTFQVCTGIGTSLKQAAETVATAAAERGGVRVNTKHIDKELDAISRRNFVGDYVALARATGWNPAIDFTEGIRRTVAAYRPSAPKSV